MSLLQLSGVWRCRWEVVRVGLEDAEAIQQVPGSWFRLHQCPVASTRNIKSGIGWLGRTDQVLGLNCCRMCNSVCSRSDAASSHLYCTDCKWCTVYREAMRFLGQNDHWIDTVPVIWLLQCNIKSFGKKEDQLARVGGHVSRQTNALQYIVVLAIQLAGTTCIAMTVTWHDLLVSGGKTVKLHYLIECRGAGIMCFLRCFITLVSEHLYKKIRIRMSLEVLHRSEVNDKQANVDIIRSLICSLYIRLVFIVNFCYISRILPPKNVWGGMKGCVCAIENLCLCCWASKIWYVPNP